MPPPVVTWLLPVRNGMPYLPETLAALESQTYRRAEILAWDNGSTDRTLDELKRWIPRRIPGRIISGRPPNPHAIPLRAIVEEAQTELCARIDSDDVPLPDRLEKQVAFLSSNPDVAVVGSQIVRTDSEGRPLVHGHAPYPELHEHIVLALLCRSSMCHPSVVFRRSAVMAVGNYRVLPNVEDYDLWFRLARAGFKLHNLPEALLRFRVHQASTTQTAFRNESLRAKTDECAKEHAPGLYGCSPRTIQLLRERRHPFPLLPISFLLRRLARQYDVNPLHLLDSRFVADGWISVTPAYDSVTRVLLRAGGRLGGFTLD